MPVAFIDTRQAAVAGQSFVMRRDAGGADAGDPKLLTVHFHGAEGAAVVVDAEGRLLASTERRELAEGSPRLLQVASGTDAGLILVAVLSAERLR